MFYFKLLTTVLKHASSRNVCILSSNVHSILFYLYSMVISGVSYLIFSDIFCLSRTSLSCFTFLLVSFFYFTVCFPIFIYMCRTSLCFLICLKIMDLFFLFVLSFFCFTYFVLFKLCLNLKQKYGFRVTGVMFRCYYL